MVFRLTSLTLCGPREFRRDDFAANIRLSFSFVTFDRDGELAIDATFDSPSEELAMPLQRRCHRNPPDEFRAAVADTCTRRSSARLGLAPARLAELVTSEHFGSAWAAVEAASPVLRHRARVTLAALPAQTARALRIRDGLRREAGRVDTALRVAAE